MDLFLDNAAFLADGLYFNGEKVKSITDVETGIKEYDDYSVVDHDTPSLSLENIKNVEEVAHMKEIKKLLPVKNIQKVKNIHEIKNIQKIKEDVAENFIQSEGLFNQLQDIKDLVDEETKIHMEELEQIIAKEEAVEEIIDEGIEAEEKKIEVLEEVKQMHEENKQDKLSEYNEIVELVQNALQHHNVESVQVYNLIEFLFDLNWMSNF